MLLQFVLNKLKIMGLEESCKSILHISKPSVSIREVSEEKSGFSKIGGAPDLPIGMNYSDNLTFIVQIKLSELPPMEDFPSKGILYFFYDLDENPWGIDPTDITHFKVLYHPDEGDLDLGNRVESTSSADIGEKRISFTSGVSIPSTQMLEDAVGDEDELLDAYDDILDEVDEDNSLHQIGGIPFIIQDDIMQEQCEDIYCQLTGLPQCEDPKHEWVLLLQLDSDDEINMEWGDMGKLYFWIRKNDLRNRNFSNCWISSQCG